MSFFSPASLLLHFQNYIPRISDKFSTNADVVGEIISGTPQILRVTDNDHGLSVGSKVIFSEGKTDTNIINAVLSIDDAGSIVRFTTSIEHDLTFDYILEVELSGFTDSAFNGVFDLVAVPSRTTFEIAFDSVPTITGSEVLRESLEIGTEGLFDITTIVDTNTYEVELTKVKTLEPQTVPVLKRASAFRMSVAADLERAIDYYQNKTSEDELYMFIIMGDASASKDRTILSDANQTNTTQNPSRVLMVNTFSITVFYPTTKDTAGARASTASWDEILKVMLLAGSGIKFDDFGNTEYVTTLIKHSASVYSKAFYSHNYIFEYNYEVTAEQQFLTQFIESRAFRDNTIALGSITGELDLDDEQ